MLKEKYSSCPTSVRELDEQGGKVIITRHFTGDKNINKVVAELAISRADREAGISQRN